MKTVKFLLVIAISLIPILLVTSDSMAWIMTYDLDITRPEEGDRFETGDVMRVRWTAYCYGQIPPQGLHYMIKLNGSQLTYDYYDDFDGAIPGQNTYFTAHGSFNWIVPGNTYYKNPNSILTIYSGDDDCPNCYDIVQSVIISIKMYYDPIPIPYLQH